MGHALVTIVAPLALDRLSDAEAAIDRLGNPAAPELQAALDRLDADGLSGTHFASLHAIRSADGERGHLVFEFSADGSEEAALDRIAGAIGERLQPVFLLASDWKDGGDFAAYLRRHRISVGAGWFDNPGVTFSGTPGMSVGRIRAEGRLAAKVTTLLAAQPGSLTALARVAAVRADLKADPDFRGVLDPATADPPWQPPSTLGLIGGLVLSFAANYLWPLLVLVLAWGVAMGVRDAWNEDGVLPVVGAFLLGLVTGTWAAAWVALVAVLIVALILFGLLRNAEARDSLEERAADPAVNAAMFARENRLTQNHMISVTQRKPGWLRAITSRLVFWAVGHLVGRFYRPGFLGEIGTIHFARWVTPPGSPDLIFLSNYDGSWESYLEDFITRAHAGLTGIWSNSVGFPRTENLIQKGATDGERFKRYARHSMIPTRFWYSAYPSLTTAAIRTNAEIRRGLSGSMTEDEAVRWLALFGSAGRPAAKLVSSEIQSLVFGGLGFMRHGTCLLFDLPDDRAAARRWLRLVRRYVAFNDGRRLRKRSVVTAAFGARGLARLGLPDAALSTFPFAFVQGMTADARARILGDVGENASRHWRWGQTQPDIVLLVYGASETAVRRLEAVLAGRAVQAGMARPHRIPLLKVSQGKKEPFGFVDGISQPVIRGTYKSRRFADPIHTVEPGEFILGYPDNRGNVPPGPTLRALDDPANLLPLVGGGGDFDRTVVDNDRDLGFNGSFLVIRELEQDVAGFRDYCRREADRLADEDRLPAPYVVDAAFVAAKLVGRWQDGSPLVRHPYEPRPRERKRYRSSPADDSQQGEASQAAELEPAREKTAPAAAPPIDPPAPSGRRDNDFLFGVEDPEALRCPFGAHIRRANPRDSFDPGSNDQIGISNRHRILRVGRQYAPEDGGNPGLLFMCLNGDIERQFEFLQQTWLNNASFHGLSCEKDPLLGDAEEGACSFMIPSREGPVRLKPMPRFVTTRGGGYFFLPGKRLIEYLSAPP